MKQNKFNKYFHCPETDCSHDSDCDVGDRCDTFLKSCVKMSKEKLLYQKRPNRRASSRSLKPINDKEATFVRASKVFGTSDKENLLNVLSNEDANKQSFEEVTHLIYREFNSAETSSEFLIAAFQLSADYQLSIGQLLKMVKVTKYNFLPTAEHFSQVKKNSFLINSTLVLCISSSLSVFLFLSLCFSLFLSLFLFLSLTYSLSLSLSHTLSLLWAFSLCQLISNELKCEILNF